MTAGGREWGREEGRRERGSRLSGSQTPSQSFPRAPEPLAARAAGQGTGAQREPVQGGRGAAAAVHAAGSGCPAPGTTRGEVRRGGRRPLRDADRQVSRAARAPRPLLSACATPTWPSPCRLSGSLWTAARAGARPGAVGVSGAPRGCARTGLGKPAAPGPCRRLRCLPSLPFLEDLFCSAGAHTHPPPSNFETLGTVNLRRPGVAAPRSLRLGRGDRGVHSQPVRPHPSLASLRLRAGGLAGQLSVGAPRAPTWGLGHSVF